MKKYVPMERKKTRKANLRIDCLSLIKIEVFNFCRLLALYFWIVLLSIGLFWLFHGFFEAPNGFAD